MYLHTVVSYGSREFVTGGPYKSYGADIQIMFIIVFLRRLSLLTSYNTDYKSAYWNLRVFYTHIIKHEWNI